MTFNQTAPFRENRLKT